MGKQVSRSAHSSEVQALLAVATLEITKGVLVLLAGLGALTLVHRDVWDIAESLLRILHLDSHRHYAQVFLRLASDVTDARLWAVAAIAAAYSGLRFLEGYGLWHQRPWAEWIALISGSIYVPFEIHDLFHRPRPLGFAIFAINLAIVLFMVHRRVTAKCNLDLSP